MSNTRAKRSVMITIACVLSAFLIGARANAQPGIFPLPSDEAATQFLKKLQDAVAAHNKDRVADLVKFPVLVRLDGKSVQIRRRTFLARYDELFTPKVKTVVLNARFESREKYDGVWWNWQGMMVGRGELWFAAYDDGSIKIKTINN